MSVYAILEIQVKDEAMYSQYKEKAPEIIKKYGGRYLVRGGNVIPVSGGWNPERIVILEFGDMDHLQKFAQSKEYGEILPIREQSTVSKVIIVEGY
jgi:uncharacterized protein (DUF1330 family)